MVVARAVKQNALTIQSHQIVTCVDLRWGGGGTFEPSRKKMKYTPQAVEVKSGSIYSVKTSRKDDRCFVYTTDGTLWFCSVENCKLARSVSVSATQFITISQLYMHAR